MPPPTIRDLNHFVILSGVAVSRSEAAKESKDPLQREQSAAFQGICIAEWEQCRENALRLQTELKFRGILRLSRARAAGSTPLRMTAILLVNYRRLLTLREC